MKSIGIDVSKEKLDVALYDGECRWHEIYENNSIGIKKLNKRLKGEGERVTMEATGTYYIRTAEMLKDGGYDVRVENPLSIKRYAEMKIRRNKTDKVDAFLIAQYGYYEEGREFRKEDVKRRIIRLKLRAVDQLHSDVNKNISRMEALNQYPEGAEEIKAVFIKMNHILEKQIEKLVKEISEIINADIAYKELSGRLQEIPGIGPRISSMLIAFFGTFEEFETAKQVSSFIGIAPTVRESGISVRGNGRISKMGNGYIRKMLTMGAKTAVKCNKSCKELDERLVAKNKPYRLRLVAGGHKLLRQAFAVAKYGVKYNPDYYNTIMQTS